MTNPTRPEEDLVPLYPEDNEPPEIRKKRLERLGKLFQAKQADARKAKIPAISDALISQIKEDLPNLSDEEAGELANW